MCPKSIADTVGGYSKSYPKVTFSYEFKSKSQNEFCNGILTIYILREEHCPEGAPTYPSVTCPADEPKKRSCDDPALQKEVQHAQHACQLSMPETEFFSNVFQWWCKDGDVYTYCGHEPKKCIQGLTCTTPDDDIPVCDPTKQECALPKPDPDTPGTPDTPIPDIEIEKPEEPPENYCELFPDMCIEPEDPKDPDLPNPDPKDPENPEKEANNHLENIHTTLDDFRSKQLLDNKVYKEWQQHMLGQMKLVNENLKNKGGGGGGGVGLQSAVAEGNLKLAAIGDTLKDIKCELDEGCESEGKEKPTVKVDCAQSIFECKGDVIQCAQLKIQYENSCPTNQLTDLKKSVEKTFGTDRTDELVDSESVDFSKIDSKFLTNGVSFGNASCPAAQSFTFNHFAGSTTVEISYEPACYYARTAAPIHVVLAWIAGLFLIGRTQGAF